MCVTLPRPDLRPLSAQLTPPPGLNWAHLHQLTSHLLPSLLLPPPPPAFSRWILLEGRRFTTPPPHSPTRAPLDPLYEQSLPRQPSMSLFFFTGAVYEEREGLPSGLPIITAAVSMISYV